MNDIFGLPMSYLLIAMLVLLGISLGAVAFIALRNRIFFLIGLRNVPRRKAQTVLIILGLMLSTLIITAAFTTGDTVNHSVTKDAYRILGHVDELVEFKSRGEAPAPSAAIPYDTFLALEAEVGGDPNIDGLTPIIVEEVPVVDPARRQSAPNARFMGLDETRMEAFPDLEDTAGNPLDLAALADDEVFVNESLADELDTSAGSEVTVYYQSEPIVFQVAAVAKKRGITGAFGGFESNGLVARLGTLQRLLERPDQIDFIAVSNTGDLREGVDRTDAVEERLERAFDEQGLQLSIAFTKQENLEIAELAGAGMMTFFLIFGLFSIAAGMLLIVMIFVMLAAERKSELGMARALGTKRWHLIETFLAEGMGYNVASAMVGAALGVGVAFGMTQILAAVFSSAEFDITIEPRVTPRSLFVAYALGVVLTFITVSFSSWRVSRLNIVAAIRDLPEPVASNSEGGTWKGLVRACLNAVVALTIIGALVHMLRGHTFGLPPHSRAYDERIPIWPLIVVPFAPFYLLALLLVRLTRNSRPRDLPSWLMLTGIILPPLGLVLVALQERDQPIAWSAGFAVLAALPASLLILAGFANEVAFPYALGVSLACFAIALVLRFFRLPERPVYTGTGLFILSFWVVTAGDLMPGLRGFQGGPEMFVLSGIVMVAAASFVIVYNADLLLAVVSAAGDRLGRLLPAVRTAIAYPLASRFRTGMTLAMIAIVVFALTMMSVMNTNFDRVFLNADNFGGWDVQVSENPNNPLPDGLTESLAGGDPAVDTSGFAAIGSLGVARPFGAELCQPDVSDCDDPEQFRIYVVKGADDTFLAETTLPFQARATGYESDRAIWEALAADPNLVVIDQSSLGDDFFDFGGGDFFKLSGVDPDVRTFEPVSIQVRDSASATTETVRVIGILTLGASGGGDPFGSFFGLIGGQALVESVFGEAEFASYFVRLNESADAEDVAQQIEGALLTTGAQAESLEKRRQEDSALFNSFFYLMQGFAGLGLFVGIAALGVVAFRSVVERRQQIGMLRAIGYNRRTVAVSFVLESAFVALLGVLSGIGLAILLASFLLRSDEFSTLGITSVYIPWGQVALIGLFALGATLLMTFVPSRQAAGVPIAEALRYE